MIGWKRFVTLSSAVAALLVFLGPALPAQAQDEEPAPPGYENSEDFEKSKEEFGQKEEGDKPPVSIRLGKDEEDEEGPRARWGGWGGPLVSYLTLDLSALEPMTDDRWVDDFSENMVLAGGIGAVAYSPPNSEAWWLFGGMGFGGGQSESVRVVSQTRKAKIDLAGGGLFAEYHYPAITRLDLALGALVGGGSITLEAEGDDLGLIDDDDWKETQSFALAYPYAGVSVEVFKWMRVEGTAGYLFMEADLGGADFVIDDSDMDMTDGNVTGGPQYMLRLVFGFE